MRYKLSLTNSWALDNDNLQPFFMAFNPQYNYEDKIYVDVNTKFNGTNNYIRSYFEGFIFNNCTYKTGIYIDDLEYCDTIKTLLVRTIRPDGDDDDYGYFINTNKALDSILVDEENEDDYYIWYVNAYTNCRDIISLREGCDGDNICEPWLGETVQNCAACAGQGPNSFINYTLRLVSIRTETDTKDKGPGRDWPENEYQEKYTEKQYEIGVQYCVYNPTAGISKETMVYDHFNNNFFGEPFGSGDEGKEMLDAYSARGKDCSIKRCRINKKGNSKCNNGGNKLFTYNKVMSFNYDPTADELALLFFEIDPNEFYSNYPLPANSPQGIAGLQWQSRAKNLAWSTDGNNVHTIIPSGLAGWTLGPLVGPGLRQSYNRTLNLDGEMTLNFQIIQN